MVLRKAAPAVIAAGAVLLGFIGLAGVGSFAAGGVPQGGGGALAQGTVPAAYQGLVQQWGNYCPAISPPMLAAQLYQESGFDPSARSGVGAMGIAQFMPDTWTTEGIDANHDGKADPWDPADAIPSMASYDCKLAAAVAKVPGNQEANMLAAYNGGDDNVRKYQGIPPFPETQGYVRSIEALQASFAAPVASSTMVVTPQASAAIYFAQTKLGTPYLWGGEGLPSQAGRFDCSGLTQAAFASVGITLPRVANDQWYAGPHPSRDQLRPGDLVFFATDLNDPRSIHHVGIYVGGGYMINAPHTGAVIRYDTINQADYIGATRVTQDGAAALPVRGADGTITSPAGPGQQPSSGTPGAAPSNGPSSGPASSPSGTPPGSSGATTGTPGGLPLAAQAHP